MKRAGLLAPLMLAACLPAGNGANPAFIRVETGGSFGGATSLTIFADDTGTTSTSGPFGEGGAARNLSLAPGTYARARAQVEALLPAALDGVETGACPDYGTDSVIFNPPVDGAIAVAVSCPDADVSALIAAINASIATPG